MLEMIATGVDSQSGAWIVERRPHRVLLQQRVNGRPELASGYKAGSGQ